MLLELNKFTFITLMKSTKKNILYLSLLLILIAAAWYLSNIFIYIVFSLVLFLVGLPINKFLDKLKIKKKHIPRPITSLLTLLILFTLFLSLVSLVIPQIIQQTKVFSKIDTYEVADYIKSYINKIEVVYNQYNNKDESLEIFLQEKVTTIIDITNISKILNFVAQLTGDIFIAVFAISFVTFFLLKDRELIYKNIFKIVPKEYEKDFEIIVGNCKHLLTRYLIGIIIQIFLIMSFITIGMTLFGIKNALLIGVFVGIFNLIPYLGPILGAVMGLFLGLSTALQMGEIDQLMPLLAKMLIVFGIVQLFDNIVFQPVIYSNSVKAHPLEIFLVILISGSVFGILGMVLAIPGYTVIRVIVKQIIDSRYGNAISLEDESK